MRRAGGPPFSEICRQSLHSAVQPVEDAGSLLSLSGLGLHPTGCHLGQIVALHTPAKPVHWVGTTLKHHKLAIGWAA